MRKSLLIAVLVLSLVCGMTCHAGSLTVDRQSVYQTGRDFVKLGMYKNALEQFSSISGYADSGSWRFYCQGMIEIQNADDFEGIGYISDAVSCVDTALRYFEMLANISFEDSESLKKYCTARRYELKGLSQTALDLYAGLLGVLDSGDRYWNIVGGKALPTQAPISTVPPVLTPIPAHVTRKASTYFGPGDSYLEQTLVSVSADKTVGVCGREGSYYLIEMTSSTGKLRAWAPTIRIQRDADGAIAEVAASSKKATVTQAAEALYGPGKDYISSGVTLAEGQAVTAFESEGFYTMIEYADKSSGKALRLWFPTAQLYIQN